MTATTWMLILIFSGGGIDHIPTANQAACEAARTALLETLKSKQTIANAYGHVREASAVVCVPIEQKISPTP